MALPRQTQTRPLFIQEAVDNPSQRLEPNERRVRRAKMAAGAITTADELRGLMNEGEAWPT